MRTRDDPDPADGPAGRRSPRRGLALGASTALVAALALLAGAPGARRPGRGPRADRAAAPRAAAAGAAPAVAARGAAGKLAPRGCTRSGTAAAATSGRRPARRPCSGGPMPIWGFSSTGAAGSATAPGPVLVVDAGRHGVDDPAQRAHRAGVAGPARPAGERLHTGLRPAEDRPASRPAAPARTRSRPAGRARSSTRRATPPAARGRSPWAWPARSSCCRRRLGVRRAQRLPGHVVRRRRRGGAQRDRPRPQRRPGDVRHAQLPRRRYRLINGKPFPSTDPISTDQGHTRAAALRQRRVADARR